MKNTQQLHTLFALSDLGMVQHHIIKEPEA